MRLKLVIPLLLVTLGVALLAWHDARLGKQLAATRAENQRLAAQAESASHRLETAESKLDSIRADTSGIANPTSQTTAASPEPQSRVAALEAQVRRLQTALARVPRGPTVPEYDPTQPPPPPPPAEPESIAEPQANAIPKRSWGTEQVLGSPDTERAGDVPTAWASREPDAGPEWLTTGFDQEVDVAEVRIRETYNPGAISKVTAVVNGQEVVLWEGTAQSGAAPRDFVVRPTYNVRASSVVVHLDTARVPGWNELDAVELVGRDGSRQWATSANASSTYAERSGNESFPQIRWQR
jgi:hypothetical protein